jgi:hypothetical protein
MALAAGLGGLAQGFAQGLKLRSDLEDAQANREFRQKQAGIMEQQRELNQLEINKGARMQETQRRIAEEFQNFKNYGGDYAQFKPQTEGVGANAPLDPFQNFKAIDFHYDRMKGLLQEQALIAGKDPFEVERSVRALRKENYMEDLGRAMTAFRLGDPSAVDTIKGVYNKSFRDGNQMTGGTFDEASGKFVFEFKTKDGNVVPRSFSRDEILDTLSRGAMNVADAAKLDMQARENEKQRGHESKMLGTKLEFEGKEGAANRTSREKISAEENKSAEKRTGISAGATIQAANIRAASDEKVAGISAETRKSEAMQTRIDRVRKDFGEELNSAFGYNDKSSSALEGAELNRLNENKTIARGILDGYVDRGMGISASEAALAVNALRNPKGTKFGTTKDADGKEIYFVETNGQRIMVPKRYVPQEFMKGK